MVTNTKIDARSSSTETVVIAVVPWLSYWSLHPHRLLDAAYKQENRRGSSILTSILWKPFGKDVQVVITNLFKHTLIIVSRQIVS